MLSVDSVYIRSLLPCSLAEVESETEFSIELVVVVLPDAAATQVCGRNAIVIVLIAIVAQLEVDSHLLGNLELIQDTETPTHCVCVVCA